MADETNKNKVVNKTVKSGITFGSALAMVISYTTWKSVGDVYKRQALMVCNAVQVLENR